MSKYEELKARCEILRKALVNISQGKLPSGGMCDYHHPVNEDTRSYCKKILGVDHVE